MSKLSRKIAFSVIISGLFIIISVMALNYQSMTLAFYSILGILIAYIFLFGLAAGQKFEFPVKTLLKNADNLSKGDFKEKVELNSKDELEDLGKIFNKVGEEFEKTKSEVEALKKSSEIKFKTKTLLSEQVISALEEKVKNRALEFERAIQDMEFLKKQLEGKDEEIKNLRAELDNLAVKKKKKKI